MKPSSSRHFGLLSLLASASQLVLGQGETPGSGPSATSTAIPSSAISTVSTGILPTTATATSATNAATSRAASLTSPEVPSSSTSASAAATSGTTQTAVSTASPTFSAAPTALVDQGVLEEAQVWCTNPIFCAGEILQTVELSKVFPDSKTFPDKPTKNPLNQTVDAWNALGDNITYSQLETFLNDYFTAEGQELSNVQIDSSFDPSAPDFLKNIQDPILRGWVVEVISYWSDLIRETNETAVCTPEKCSSTLIPLNQTIVVPGGRYREVYYWDSFWIIEGLLNSGLAQYAKDIILNFMDQLEVYGFIPNGGRTYYLNRSQPPMFTQMLHLYTEFTKDTSLLERGLPLADLEFNWWSTNRTFEISSPYTNKTHQVARYDVFLNTAPRPEGYLEDYETINEAEPPFTQEQAKELYAELASGAESGWDFTARFMKEPLTNVSDPLQGLRSLNIRQIAPVDLNAILVSNHFYLADLYDQASFVNCSSSGNWTGKADLHRQQGAAGVEMINDLFWDPEKLAYYDFNTTASDRSSFWSLASMYPFWLNIYPPDLVSNETALFGAFSSINLVLHKYNGSVPCTLVNSTLNWDFPNSWPSLVYIVTKAIDNLPKNATSSAYSTIAPEDVSAFSLVPPMQLGVDSEGLLPPQRGIIGILGNPNSPTNSSTTSDKKRGDVGILNGGNVTLNESWRDVLLTQVINRYMSSAFCSWYSTGGSLPGILEQLPAAELNVTNSSPISTGQMFEKFDATDVDAAGGGGEYVVQTGFGWTNGVAIWMAATYGNLIASPVCPEIIIEENPALNETMLAKGSRVKDGRWLSKK